MEPRFTVDTFDLFGRRLKGHVKRTRKDARKMAHFIRVVCINGGRMHGGHIVTDVQVTPA